MILILKMEDGTIHKLEGSDSVHTLLRLIRDRDVETIGALEINDRDAVWEKQFKATDIAA